MARRAKRHAGKANPVRRDSWDREAFRLSYQDHSGAVHAAAQGFCGADRADEVTGEVFLHLWRHPEHQGATRASLRISLLTVAHDLSVEVLRSGVPPDEPSAVEPLDALGRGEREAIVTTRFGRCSAGDTAVVLGLDRGTVNSRLRAGLRHLRVAHTSDEGLGAALDARQVVAAAQGKIMERDGSSAPEAHRTLVQWSESVGISSPVAAELVVSSSDERTADADPVDR